MESTWETATVEETSTVGETSATEGTIFSFLDCLTLPDVLGIKYLRRGFVNQNNPRRKRANDGPSAEAPWRFLTQFTKKIRKRGQ